jgi:hypothetical protein
MTISFKSFTAGILVGCFFSFLFLFSPAIAHIPTLKSVEKHLDAFVHAFHCRIAVVEEVDVWERKVLVNARGIRFVMTAINGETYEICPVGTGPKSLKDAPRHSK